MTPEQIAQLAAQAREAIEAGADSTAVATRFREMTGQDLPAPEQPKPAPPEGGAVLDFLQMLSQGATARFGDEIAGLAAVVPGGMTPSEARAYSRKLTARAKERHSKTSILAEGLGAGAVGAMAPAAMGARAVAAGSGIVAPALTGAALGGLEGSLFGAGGAEGGIKERAKAAVKPGLIGAALGGLFSMAPAVVNAVTRRTGGRGERVAGTLRETSGVTDDINVTRKAAEDAAEAARVTGYRQFEKAPPVTQMDIAGGRLPNAIKDRLPKGDVTFQELQDLRSTLRAEDNEAGAGILSRFMEKHFPGLRDADKLYAGAKDVERTLETGTKAASKSGADIEWLSRGMSPERSQTFRTGLIQKTADALTMRDEQAGAMLRSLMDQGPAGARKVRQYFPAGSAGDDAFTAFQRTLNTERSAEKVGAAFKRLVTSRLLWFGGGGAAGALASRSLFD